MLRTIRSSHSSVVNSPRTRRYSSRSKVAIWIGRELVDPERVLALRLLVVLEAHVDLRPDAAHHEPLVVADVVLGDVHVLVAEVRDLGPVVRVDEADLHLVDEGVLAALLDLAWAFIDSSGADVVVRQRVVDDLQPHLDRDLVRRRAVLPEQELEDEDRHVRADLHLAHEVLADHLAGEQPVHLVVEGVSCGDGAVAHGLHSKSNGDVGGRAVQLRVGRRVLHHDAQRRQRSRR